MKNTPKPIHPLLDQMSRIERMERGKICRMSGRPHYNHQTWQNGRNRVRYVSADQRASLQQAIEGYQMFMKLAQQYAEEIIQRTRLEHSQDSSGPRRSKSKK